VGNTVVFAPTENIHAPLHGAFLAISPKEVTDVKDGCGGYSNIHTRKKRIANKHLVLTMPARRSFSIIARHNGLGVVFGFILPFRALAWPHKRSVSTLSYREL
jgi:hypothetical protein